ncbi:MAG TPA: hypothetical protein VGD81_08235, partial [Opitutaceae bacterium]
RPALLRAVPWLVPLGAAALFAIAGGLVWLQAGARRRDTALYRAAVADHVNDVVKKVGRPGWQTSPEGLSSFALAATGTADVLSRISLTDTRLVRARACRLGGIVFAHFIYEADGREFSVFVRRDRASLRGPTLDVVRDRPVRGCDVDDFGSVGFQTQDLTVLIVADSPRDDVLRLARRLVEQLS